MTAEAQGREAARSFRQKHQLGAQPLGDLVALIELSTSHDVAVLDVGPDEHGLTMRDPQRNVVFIGVARTRHPMRQRSTLAHELAHVIFGDWDMRSPRELGKRTFEEIRADVFARHLLVPAEGLAELLGNPHNQVTEDELSSVVQRFLVSPQVAAIALCDSGYIDESKKREWMGWTTPRLATRFGWSDQYHMLQADSDRTRVPQRLLSRTIAGYEAGVVSGQTVATLRGIPLNEAIRELEEAEIFPASPTIPSISAEDLPELGIDLGELDAELSTEDQPQERLPGTDGSTS